MYVFGKLNWTHCKWMEWCTVHSCTPGSGPGTWVQRPLTKIPMSLIIQHAIGVTYPKYELLPQVAIKNLDLSIIFYFPPVDPCSHRVAFVGAVLFKFPCRNIFGGFYYIFQLCQCQCGIWKVMGMSIFLYIKKKTLSHESSCFTSN